MQHMKKINLAEKFSLFTKHWDPKIVGELNNQHVKLVKFAGEFDWHSHKDEDELFLVVQGELVIELRDQVVKLEEGEFIISPKGTEHRPVATDEVYVMLIELKSTINTGNVQNERTIKVDEIIGLDNS